MRSCKPNACTRDSRDSFTLRSNPEYEWMMYHFMFGLRGGSLVAVASPLGAGFSPLLVSFFSSSCIVTFFKFPCFRQPRCASVRSTQSIVRPITVSTCLLYTSDAADERSSVDLGGRRII